MKTNQLFKFLFLSIAILFISENTTAQNLEKEIKQYITNQYDAEDPGISLLVAKDGKTIYKTGFGMSNIELGVKNTPDNVYEIGSITKQFTAVAILMLQEQGKLKVTDEITKLIPEYPTKGKSITIHQLLNHTSGIKSYTSMPSFMSEARTDLTPSQLIDVFKNESFDFEPGTEFLYNNSGYIILGHIIEIASGMSYADFIQTNIFDTLGMENSYYGSMSKIIKNRASGYSETDNGYKNADYLSLTLPYAAGSIMSTIEDLLKWQNAISANTLITRKSLETAINGSTLITGEEIPYGYGWIKGNINGSTTVEHSGGIFGYSTNGIFLPEENMYVIGLSNCDCNNVSGLINNVAALAIGKPFQNLKDAITLNELQAKKWVGAYEFDGNIIRYITVKEGKLFSLREGSVNLEIYPMTETNFIFDDPGTSYNFFMENGNRMVTMSVNGNKQTGKGIAKAPPAAREEITLSESDLAEYAGKYELQPGFNIEISTRDGRLFGIATGQGEFELFATKRDIFFLKVVAAEITFSRNNIGVVDSLTLNQGGQQMPGKKIE